MGRKKKTLVLLDQSHYSKGLFMSLFMLVVSICEKMGNKWIENALTVLEMGYTFCGTNGKKQEVNIKWMLNLVIPIFLQESVTVTNITDEETGLEKSGILPRQYRTKSNI